MTERMLAAAAIAALVFAGPAEGRGQRVSAFWRALAHCETDSRWHWGALHRPGEGHTYEGGLGFYAPTWTLWARRVGVWRRYPHAYQAPPAVQVRVGRYGLAHHGSWGCLREHPELYLLPGR